MVVILKVRFEVIYENLLEIRKLCNSVTVKYWYFRYILGLAYFKFWYLGWVVIGH